jgi:hypothetical protein
MSSQSISSTCSALVTTVGTAVAFLLLTPALPVFAFVYLALRGVL